MVVMKKILKVIGLIVLILICGMTLLQVTYKNKGESSYTGSVSKGKLYNSYLMPYSGKNFSYFSPMSYYAMGNAYVHSKLYHTLLSSYKVCEHTCPDIKFKLMECANKKGGKMLIHRTHQTGLSVDFMTPLIKNGKQKRLYDHMGLGHYLLEFDDRGRLSLDKNVTIDFETLAKHIISLDDAARKNGLYIKKVIWKIELKDELFATNTGKLLKKRGIYFAKALGPEINALHDDHYHIDFALISK